MIPSAGRFVRLMRRAVAALLSIQGVWCLVAAVTGSGFSGAPGGRITAVAFTLVLYGTALAVLVAGRFPDHRFVRASIVAVALLFTARWNTARVMNGWYETVVFRVPEESVSPLESSLNAALREIGAGEEQARLALGVYTDRVADLGELSALPSGTDLTLVAHGARGWRADIARDSTHCSIWARDASLRRDPWEVEGSPACGVRQALERHRVVSSFPPEAAGAEGRFTAADVGGEWLQHRGDAERSANASGDSPAPTGRTWTTQLQGELRASVAIAGNQVFVGAHGNGEFVALTLDSGRIGFRVRAPNWIHHEPVVSDGLVIVGFGNNEVSPTPWPVLGTPPSGLVAFDRRTGRERWRRYTPGSAMASPVVWRDVVAAATTSGAAAAWSVADGTPLWETRLPSSTAMSNAVLVDSTIIVGLEQTQSCALNVHSGAILYCTQIRDGFWGAGHASPAIAGDLVLQTMDAGMPLGDALRGGWWWYVLRVLMAGDPGNGEMGQMTLVAMDRRTGAERWRRLLGAGPNESPGHIAGTPVVVDGVAYVAAPIGDRIVAVTATTGALLWSTKVRTARGSVLVTRGAVLAATRDTGFVVLDAATGKERCRQRLPGVSDRAGPTLAGETAILTTRSGLVLARPIDAWLACRA